MSNVVTVTTSEGSFTIKADLLKEYRQRAFEALDKEAEAKQDFKDEVEGAAEGVESTTLEGKQVAKMLSKYFKASYKEQTEEAQQLGEVFGQLDEAVKA